MLVLEQAEKNTLIVEQLPFEPTRLSAPTIEAFYRRALLDDLAVSQQGGGPSATAHWMQQSRRPGGHFAGIQFYLDKVDTSKWPHRLPSPAGASMAASMEQDPDPGIDTCPAVEAEITDGLGRLEDFDPSDEDVTVRAGSETFRRPSLVWMRWRPQRADAQELAASSFIRDRSRVHRLFGRSRNGGSRSAQPRASLHADGHVPVTRGQNYRHRSSSVRGIATSIQPIALGSFQGCCCLDARHRTDSPQKLATTWTDRAYQATTY